MQEQAGLPFRHREMRGTTGLCRILLGSPRHLGYNPREASLLESAFPVFLLLLSYLTVKWTFLAGGGARFGAFLYCTEWTQGSPIACWNAWRPPPEPG